MLRKKLFFTSFFLLSIFELTPGQDPGAAAAQGLALRGIRYDTEIKDNSWESNLGAGGAEGGLGSFGSLGAQNSPAQRNLAYSGGAQGGFKGLETADANFSGNQNGNIGNEINNDRGAFGNRFSQGFDNWLNGQLGQRASPEPARRSQNLPQSAPQPQIMAPIQQPLIVFQPTIEQPHSLPQPTVQQPQRLSQPAIQRPSYSRSQQRPAARPLRSQSRPAEISSRQAKPQEQRNVWTGPQGITEADRSRFFHPDQVIFGDQIQEGNNRLQRRSSWDIINDELQSWVAKYRNWDPSNIVKSVDQDYHHPAWYRNQNPGEPLSQIYKEARANRDQWESDTQRRFDDDKAQRAIRLAQSERRLQYWRNHAENERQAQARGWQDPLRETHYREGQQGGWQDARNQQAYTVDRRGAQAWNSEYQGQSPQTQDIRAPTAQGQSAWARPSANLDWQTQHRRWQLDSASPAITE